MASPTDDRMLVRIFDAVEVIPHLSAEELIYKVNAISEGWPFKKRADLFESLYAPISERCADQEKLRVESKFSLRIADLKRDANDLDGQAGARAWYQRSFALHKMASDLEGLASCQLGLGACHEMTSSYAAALRHYNLALHLVEGNANLVVLEGRITMRIGAVLTKQLELDAAKPFLRRALERVGRAGHKDSIDLCVQKLVIHALKGGKLDQALLLFEFEPSLAKGSSEIRRVQRMVLEADLALANGETGRCENVLDAATSKILDLGLYHQLQATRRVRSKLIAKLTDRFGGRRP